MELFLWSDYRQNVIILFCPSANKKTVTVLETRINQYGETWVKYQIEDDDGIGYCPAQNFDRLFEKK